MHIQQTILSTQLKFDISNGSAGDEHECELCKRILTNEECEIFDNLEALEKSVESDVAAAILYIAGYLQKQACQICDNDTMYYYDKFGKYLDQLNRGAVVLPQDHLVQWCIYCFVLFTQIGEWVCRTFLINLFTSISEKWHFNISLKNSRILSNIFLKNYLLFCSPRSSKEASLKLLKLNKFLRFSCFFCR